MSAADIRVVHAASRSRHPLAIRPANNGAGSRVDGKVMKSPSKNRQARNRQRRQHCKQAKKPHACSRPPARSTGCGHHRRRQQHGGQQEVVNQNNVVSEEQLAALLAAAQLQEVPPPPPPPSLVPRSSLVLTVDEQQDGDEMDMEELELDDDPYTAAARACSNGNGVNDEVDDALAHTYTETERELAEHAALHARIIVDKWRICTQRRPQSQHGARQDPQSNEDKAAVDKPTNTTHTPAAVDAADTGTEATIEQPPAPPARDCRRFAAMYERMISPSAQQTPGLVC